MEAHRAPGELIAQRYRVLGTLGVGGYGAVHHCQRLSDGMPLAVKVMLERLGGSEIAYARFEREAATCQRLRHPHIVAPIDYGMTEQRLPYIAFELLDGMTLKRALEQHGALGVRRAAWIARQMLSALSCAHDAGVVHRDVKPANVFLCRGLPPDRDVKILDFGIAKAAEGQGVPHLTATGQMLGTPQYMAPEQVRGSRLVDGRADLYAVGTVLAEMLSGRKLVVGDTDIEVFMAHISDDPLTLPPAVTGSALGPVIARAVAKQPEARYPSAAAMLADLDAVIAALGDPYDAPVWSGPRDSTFVLPSPPAPMAPAPAMAGGRPGASLPLILSAAVGAALALGVVAGVVAWSLAQRAEPPPRTERAPAANAPDQDTLARCAHIRRRLVEEGFEILAEQSGRTDAGSHATIAFRRGEAVGHVTVYQYASTRVASAVHENLSRSPTTAAVRDGRVVVSLGYPVDARRLIRKLVD